MSDTFDRTPPHDLDAERAALGAMLISPGAASEVEGIISEPDLYDPRHRLVFATTTGLRAAQRPADVVAVNAELQQTGQLSKIGHTYLADLVQSVPTAANAVYYARTVRDRAMLRNVITAATRSAQHAYEPGDDSGHDIAQRAADAMAGVRDQGMLDDDLPTQTLRELLETPIEYDWLIPGLLERGDRVILTGAEGLGKSTLGRQIAVCTAAGLHPFTHRTIPSQRVLVVDCENGRALSQRRYGPLAAAARQAGHPVPEGRFWIEVRPEGLDLTTAADTRWLLKRVETLHPDLLVIGPIYKLHASDPNDERSARAVAAALDRARTYGTALLIETHSPHGSGLSKRPLRPVGSSLWLRWPEFGFGIRPADTNDAELRRLVDVEDWRGARDEREWPEQLETGGSWPWNEAVPGFNPYRAGVA